MSTTRRSLFAIFAGGFAAAFMPAQARQSSILSAALPERELPSLLSTTIDPDVAAIIGFKRLPAVEGWPSPRGETLGTFWISTGEDFVLLDSPEGQAVLNSMAVNLRSDGTIAHRQHHPTDFPPKVKHD